MAASFTGFEKGEVLPNRVEAPAEAGSPGA
jgi:hypothetical protein